MKDSNILGLWNKGNIYGPGNDDYGRDKWYWESQIKEIYKMINDKAMKPKYVKPGLYTMFYTYMKEIAEEYGYNLIIHGSMNRDLDLIAIPWVDNPKPEQDMIKEFQQYLRGCITTDPQGDVPFTILPGNRHSYVIDLNRGDKHGEWVRFSDQEFYIDISVVQLTNIKDK